MALQRQIPRLHLRWFLIVTLKKTTYMFLQFLNFFSSLTYCVHGRPQRMGQRTENQSNLTPASWLTLSTFWGWRTSWGWKWTPSGQWGSFQKWTEPQSRLTPCLGSRGTWSGSSGTCAGGTGKTRTLWVMRFIYWLLRTSYFHSGLVLDSMKIVPIDN